VTQPTGETLRIERGKPLDDAQRDEFVRSHPSATFFHLSGWRRAVERVFGHRPHDLLAWRGEELVGVLPLMACRGLSGRRNLISIPYSVYGGIVARDDEALVSLLRAADDLAEAEDVGRLELRWPDPPPAVADGALRPGVATDLYWTFRRELPDDPAEVLARMPKKARAEARKARNRHGLELGHGPWYLDDLVRLFHVNKQSLGSPGLPLSWFQTLLQELGRDVHVHIVRRHGRPIAAAMSFGFRGTFVAYYSGAQRGADREVSASNFLYMALQEWAVNAGYRVFDFCRSRKDTGAFSFKVHQGFEPQQLHYRYHLVRDRAAPAFTPSNPKTRVLQQAWSRLPHWLARRLSDHLAPRLG
jgi:FemAB-related protein (PEP-CTERM system-associated)